MKIKKIFAFLISIILSILCVCMSADAKVIEPEVVKTEKWVTSYYLDDDLEELYPFIRCEADIYNDGTIKLYLWNMHEWDGFATVSHRATIVQTTPVKQGSMFYCFHNGTTYSDIYRTIIPITQPGFSCDSSLMVSVIDGSWVKEIDMSYYPTEYSLAQSGYNYGFSGYTHRYSFAGTSITGTEESIIPDSFEFLRYYAPMPSMPFYESRPTSPVYVFEPTEDPTGTYEFRLFGHDITITPELLSGKVVPTPTPDDYQTITYRNGSAITRLKADTDLSDIQEYINQLETENARLRQETTDLETQLDALKRETPDNRIGDIDRSGGITIHDVNYLLRYYTELRVSKTTTDSLAIWFGNYELSKE